MSVALSPRQQDELHKAILEYLSEAGFPRTCNQLKEESPDLSDFEPNANPRTRGLLAKKWTSVIRMQKKIINLESQLAQATEELSQVGHVAGGAQRKTQDWQPTHPARHVLIGHRDRVNAVSFHPAFSSIASASADATVKIWDWETGELERTLKGHTKDVTDCQYDSKGKHLATSSNDLFIKLWDAENDYKNSTTLRGHEHTISSVRFMPGDDRLVSASRDRTVRVWAISSAHCIRVIKAHDDWIRCAVPSSDRRWLLTCSNDFTARIVEAETGTMKAEMRGHEHIVEVAVFAPSIATPSIRELSASSTTSTLSSSADAKAFLFVATGSRDKTIKIWDALRAQCVRTLIGHDNWVKALLFHPSGKYLLSAGDDATVRVWDLKTGRCTKTLEDVHRPFVSCLSWGRQTIGESPAGDNTDGERRLVNVIATGGMDKTVKVWLPSRHMPAVSRVSDRFPHDGMV